MNLLDRIAEAESPWMCLTWRFRLRHYYSHGSVAPQVKQRRAIRSVGLEKQLKWIHSAYVNSRRIAEAVKVYSESEPDHLSGFNA